MTTSQRGRVLQRAGLALTLLLVAVLAGSLVLGLQRGGGTALDAAAPADLPERGERVRVEVLNAAGAAGLARRGTEHLRAAGFDVVYYGNAASFGIDTTAVLARLPGAAHHADAVLDALGTGVARTEPDSARYVDVTVLLGRDWVEVVEGDSVG